MARAVVPLNGRLDDPDVDHEDVMAWVRSGLGADLEVTVHGDHELAVVWDVDDNVTEDDLVDAVAEVRSDLEPLAVYVLTEDEYEEWL